MKQTLIIALVCGAISPAFAQSDILKRTDDQKRKHLCSAVMYEPSDDVAYQPGVTVTGKMVVPADLNPSPIIRPEAFSFPITRDLAEFLGPEARALGPYEMEATFGTIDARLNKAGGYDLFYNGEALKPGWEHSLRELCSQEEITVTQ